ncbi:MAG: ATPase [Candidatus Azotimanducaceae bacterium]|uniref:Adenine nucleotide alpha hydrolase n=1 Tax=OM182 bacterium TaxID=2510334 RepID=A0A520RZM3_9GAMM|nr:adenine nucleotide alpha hydrolase [Gammaproteobacteria bacterium]OUV68829.1 MAG: hypothetical protein CBC93_00420 [Gammaproteobacteria bacterium TMED133]RZO75658.1 MAG: adenine nucleotide alpha hydrolase [OM182 bacterium]
MSKLDLLEKHLLDRGPLAIAVSGGVDSMTLAVVAHRASLDTEMYHAISPAVPLESTALVRRYAEDEGWNLTIVTAGEIEDPQYLANPANRCYYCKTNLYATLSQQTELTIASGTNMDDLGDYRPGLEAAKEHRVVHPYVETGISKTQLRDIAKSLSLTDLQDLPSSPCLSSRVTTGIAIDATLLPVINLVERELWTTLISYLPLQAVRCRILPDSVTIQIDSTEVLDPNSEYNAEVKKIVRRIFKVNGFDSYSNNISIEPYKRGSAFLIETLTVQ